MYPNPFEAIIECGLLKVKAPNRLDCQYIGENEINSMEDTKSLSTTETRPALANYNSCNSLSIPECVDIMGVIVHNSNTDM